MECRVSAGGAVIRSVWKQQLFIWTILRVREIQMRKMIRLLCGVLLFMAFFVITKNEYGYLLSGDNYGMEELIRKQEADNLFIGSSMFRQGLDIHILEKNLGESVYILSYNGNQPVFMAEELEYLLNHGVKVKNLYIDLYAYTAAASPWISDTKMFLDTDMHFKRNAWTLMKENNNVDFRQFYEMFVTANNDQLFAYPLNHKVVSSQFYKGGSLLQPAGREKAYLDGLDLGVRDGLNARQLEGYGKIKELAERNGIHLLFLETPKYEKLYEDRRTGGYPELLNQLETMAAKEHISCLEAGQLSFNCTDGKNFQDLIHLSAQGRERYSRQLCERINSGN